MRSVRLVAVCDQYDRAPGFAIRGSHTSADDFMADREGALIAHDLLEHCNGAGEIGSVWDELEALGALYYVRGQFGDLLQGRNYQPVWYNLAADLTRMFQQYVTEYYDGPNMPRVSRRVEDDAESTFTEAIARARADIPRECNDMGRGEPDEDENGWSPALHQDFARYLVVCLVRMRIGYRKARRRYRNAWKAHNQFRAIQAAVKEAHAHNELFEGAEYILTYGNERASVRPVWE